MHRLGAIIRKKTDMRKLTIKQDWYKKQPESEDKYIITKWGNKKINTSKSGCSTDPPSAPLFVPRTPGGP